MPLHRLVELVSTNAARRFGLYPRKGTIQVGADADLVILDSGRRPVAAAQSPSVVDYSPYEGTVLKMWPRVTIRGGVIAYADGDINDDLPRCRILNDEMVVRPNGPAGDGVHTH